MLTESAEDLNLSLVVDEASSSEVVSELHQRLFGSLTKGNGAAREEARAAAMIDRSVLGSTWEELCAQAKSGQKRASGVQEQNGGAQAAGNLPPQMRLP